MINFAFVVFEFIVCYDRRRACATSYWPITDVISKPKVNVVEHDRDRFIPCLMWSDIFSLSHFKIKEIARVRKDYIMAYGCHSCRAHGHYMDNTQEPPWLNLGTICVPTKKSWKAANKQDHPVVSISVHGLKNEGWDNLSLDLHDHHFWWMLAAVIVEPRARHARRPTIAVTEINLSCTMYGLCNTYIFWI